MKLSLSFSPCPNDTFIFDALVHEKIDTEGLKFDIRLEDIQNLNRLVLAGETDISKISYGVLPLVIPDYQVLNSGGALGTGTGPLLIAKHPFADIDEEVPEGTIALPGIHTTAHLLFSLAFPSAKKKLFMPFNQIEASILSGMADSGVIIHESRFTYQSKGLYKLADLGEVWEENTGHPIPLGGVVIRRELDHMLMQKVDRVIRRSVEYAMSKLPVLPAYVIENAQEMDEQVMRSHIDLYVNEYSVELGKKGRGAVWKLMEIASAIHPEPVAGSYEIFV
jgi:1,4-dihydroxy-6-naphthoate synthase